MCYNPPVKVSEIGEFSLIEHISSLIDKSNKSKYCSGQKLVIGIGDDAAVWKSNSGLQLLTTDSMIENVHFNIGTISWEELGWKSIAVNVSDIAAMGGLPCYAIVALALRGDIEVESISQMYQGMISLCDQYKISIVGGNISSSERIMITVAIVGSLLGKSMLTRSAAKSGDLIAVTGHTGLSMAGLKMLKHGLSCDTDSKKVLREAHLKPVAKIEEGQVLLKHGVKAAIDISDGLISDLTHICKASNVGALLEQNKVPIHQILLTYFRDDYLSLVLTGGEDYELLFTAPSSIMIKLKSALSCPVNIIGRITKDAPGQVMIVDDSGNRKTSVEYGWEHFKSNP